MKHPHHVTPATGIPDSGGRTQTKRSSRANGTGRRGRVRAPPQILTQDRSPGAARRRAWCPRGQPSPSRRAPRRRADPSARGASSEASAVGLRRRHRPPAQPSARFGGVPGGLTATSLSRTRRRAARGSGPGPGPERRTHHPLKGRASWPRDARTRGTPAEPETPGRAKRLRSPRLPDARNACGARMGPGCRAVGGAAGTAPHVRVQRRRRGRLPPFTGGARQAKTTVRVPLRRMRRSACHLTARARAWHSTSRPTATSWSGVTSWPTRSTSCSMIGPSSRSAVT